MFIHPIEGTDSSVVLVVLFPFPDLLLLLKIKQNPFQFLLINSLVRHKARRLVSRYKVWMRRLYRILFIKYIFIKYYCVHLNRKRVAYREGRKQGVSNSGSEFEFQIYHLHSMTLFGSLNHFEPLFLQLKRELKIILFALQD